MVYRPHIDGLRAIAVLAVILFHAQVTGLPGGFLGVDVFFVISGYLITGLLLEEFNRPRGLAFFYERRIRRIAPALGVVLLASVVAAWWLMPTMPMLDFGSSLMAAAASAANLFFWRTSGYFDLGAGERPLLHLWSLGVEEQFYLMYPALLLWVGRRGRTWLLPAVWLGLLSSFALSLAAWHTRPLFDFYMLPTRSWQILAGAVAALTPAARIAELSPRWRQGLSLGSLMALIASFFWVQPRPELAPWLHAWPVIATALLILLAVQDGPAAQLLRCRPLVAVGLVSYSAYLWHQPLFDFARMALLEPPRPIVIVLLIGLTFVLAAASWKWVEQPARRPTLGTGRRVFAFAAAGALAFLGIGYALSRPSALQNWRVGPATLAEEAAIAAQEALRQVAIRAGECNFNGIYGRYQKFPDFLANWACWGSLTPRTVVVGDSHAADVAAALRVNGRDVGQMTGAGCSLVPSLMSAQCRAQFDRLHMLAASNGVGTLVLANRYEPAELTPDAAQEMLQYWQWSGVTLWIVTGMPEFPDLNALRTRVALLGRQVQADQLQPDLHMSRMSEAFAHDFAARAPGTLVINTRELFCGIGGSAGCSWRVQGEALSTDGHHLSMAGAARFGRRWLEVTPVAP